MDPLSVIASVIAISEALGMGIRGLKSLSNASAEFGEMLDELSSLQACIDQLCSTVHTMTDPRLSQALPGGVIARLGDIRLELAVISGATEDIAARLLRGKFTMPFNRKGEPKVSVINWQRERRKAIKLRDDAKRCREDLSICLGLLGVSEQLEQRKIGMEVLAVSQSQHFLMQSFLARFETRIDALESNLLTAPSNALEATPTVQDPGSSVSPSIHDWPPFQQRCSRYCRCQCHRITAVRAPSWTRALFGSLVAQYTGVHEPYGVYYATNECETEFFKEKLSKRELLPTDITQKGEGYFVLVLSAAHALGDFRLVQLFLDFGFCPSFVDLRGVSPSLMAKRWLTRYFHAHQDPERTRIFKRIAGSDDDDSNVSTMIKDSVLGIGNVTLEDALAAEPSQINAIDSTGYSPLHWAAACGYFDKVQLLIQSGAATDLPIRTLEDSTALHIAVAHDYPRLVSLLIESGANVDAGDVDGCPPLHFCRSLEIVRILLVADARPNAICHADGRNALHHFALTHPCREVDGRQPALSAMSALVEAGADCNLPDRKGDPPILLAAQTGNVAVMQHLHSLGAEPGAINNYGTTILDSTAQYHGLKQLQLLRTMYIRGIDPDDTSFGSSVVEDFEDRMFPPGFHGQRRPTQTEVFSFYALVSEIRQRNWESGLFLYSKPMLETDGRLDRLRRWLGWQWQRLHDDDDFAECIWDPKWDAYPDDYTEDDSDSTDYDMSALFGETSGDDVLGHDVEPVPYQEKDEGADEFFDAAEHPDGVELGP